jgi:hypothetical protein
MKPSEIYVKYRDEQRFSLVRSSADQDKEQWRLQLRQGQRQRAKHETRRSCRTQDLAADGIQQVRCTLEPCTVQAWATFFGGCRCLPMRPLRPRPLHMLEHPMKLRPDLKSGPILHRSGPRGAAPPQNSARRSPVTEPGTFTGGWSGGLRQGRVAHTLARSVAVIGP